MRCAIHSKEMKVGSRGNYFCPTPIEKNPDGSVAKWCKYQPEYKPENSGPSASVEAFERSLEAPSLKGTESAYEKDVRISKLSLISSMTQLAPNHIDFAEKSLDEVTDIVIKQTEKLLDFVYKPYES